MPVFKPNGKRENPIVFPLSLSKEELAQIRALPAYKRSKLLREALYQAGVLRKTA